MTSIQGASSLIANYRPPSEATRALESNNAEDGDSRLLSKTDSVELSIESEQLFVDRYGQPASSSDDDPLPGDHPGLPDDPRSN